MAVVMIEKTPVIQKIFMSKAQFTVCSFFTIGTEYEKIIRRLIESLERFEISYYMEGVRSQGTWEANVRLKPFWIRKTAETLYCWKSIVWIDADGVVQEFPELFNTLQDSGFEFGVHYRRGRELLSGTIWMMNTPHVWKLLEAWMETTRRITWMKDQQTLQDVLAKTAEWKVCRLPAQYTQIFDLMKHEGKAVVEHFQASRRNRRSLHAPLSTHGLR
jgi:hypothetical protein